MAKPLEPKVVNLLYIWCHILSIWLGSCPIRPSEKSSPSNVFFSTLIACAITIAPPPPELVHSPTPVIFSSVSTSTNIQDLLFFSGIETNSAKPPCLSIVLRSR